MELFEAIKSRRSIRRYKADPVRRRKNQPYTGSRPLGAVLGQHAVLALHRRAGRQSKSWTGRYAYMKIKLPDKEMPNPGANALNTVPVVIVVCAEIGKSGLKPGPGGGSRRLRYR